MCIRGARETARRAPDDDGDAMRWRHKKQRRLRQRERRNGTWIQSSEFWTLQSFEGLWLAFWQAARPVVSQLANKLVASGVASQQKAGRAANTGQGPNPTAGPGTGSMSGLHPQHGCQFSGVWVSIWRVASQEECWPANNKNRWRRMWPNGKSSSRRRRKRSALFWPRSAFD